MSVTLQATNNGGCSEKFPVADKKILNPTEKSHNQNDWIQEKHNAIGFTI